MNKTKQNKTDTANISICKLKLLKAHLYARVPQFATLIDKVQYVEQMCNYPLNSDRRCIKGSLFHGI